MVQGLNGIEAIVRALNPETGLLDTYQCSGYYNTGRFILQEGKPDKLIQGKLVDWYRPLSKEGQHHSLEFLQLYGKLHKRLPEMIYKGQPQYDELLGETK